MIYEILIEGQRLNVSEEVATSDERVKDMLKPFWPDVVNAAITRAVKDDVTTVTVVKRAGTKGLLPMTALEKLIAAPESQNPAVAKARELSRVDEKHLTVAELLELGGQAEAAIEEGKQQEADMQKARQRLERAKGGDARQLPTGF